jgi:hypothetical protein
LGTFSTSATCCLPISASGDNSTSLSTTLASSRTLPNHGYSRSAWIASGETPSPSV